MKRIGLLSDTHGYLDDRIYEHLKDCDEIWHAGDIGSMETLETLESWKPLKAVYGNIDNHKIRASIPEKQRFRCENMNIYIKHIGGYPGRYDATAINDISSNPPDIFISGHSHILKVMPDKKYDLLHINPGAAGKHGLHSIRTLVRFSINSNKIVDLEVVELGKRW